MTKKPRRRLELLFLLFSLSFLQLSVAAPPLSEKERARLTAPPQPKAESGAQVIEEPEAPPEGDGIYDLRLESSIGTLTYYHQGDARWANAIYGGTDTIAGYGCGPTALAMVINSFSPQRITPPELAAWAAANGYWSSGSGSAHSLIPEGAAAFGLTAAPLTDLTEDGVKNALLGGNVLIALMGPGHFTKNGHFIVIADYYTGTQVTVADPASLENTQTPWEISLILGELSRYASSGGPIWALSLR